MEEDDDVSKGFSSISRSDLKIGDDELIEKRESITIQRVNPILNPGNTVQASKSSEKANELSQVVRDSSQSFVKGREIQKFKPCPNKLDLNTDVVCDLVKRNDAECLANQRSGFDLNADAVSTCLNDELSSVCSSRNLEKSKSTNVYSECGSSNEDDSMKMWKKMKQNGFLSYPHGGISSASAASSNCLVSSSHGGIPAPKKRGRKTKNNDVVMVKKRKIEIAKKEEVDRFPRLAAPSGLLNDLNPGIINHVRNKKQVLSIIENIIKSDRDSGNLHHHSMKHTSEGSRKILGDKNTDVSMQCYEEKCAGKFSENASSLSSDDTTDLNGTSVLTVKAATVASQWLDLLHQDIKGRVSALRRSKKRVRAVVTTELPFLIAKEFTTDQENDPNILLEGASRSSSTVDLHKTRWMALFNQLEQTLSEEEKQLESWLNQVRELQSHCDNGLQYLSLSSGQNLNSRAANDKDLVIRAAAASMYSTCNFLASKENVTCT